MSETEKHHHLPHLTTDQAGEDAALAVGIGIRGSEVGLVLMVTLLVCPPLLTLAVVLGGALMVLAIVIGALSALVLLPYVAVRHVLAHHRTHGTSFVRHRLSLRTASAG